MGSTLYTLLCTRIRIRFGRTETINSGVMLLPRHNNMERFDPSRHDLIQQGASSEKPSRDPATVKADEMLHARGWFPPYDIHTLPRLNSTTQPQLIARPLTVMCSPVSLSSFSREENKPATILQAFHNTAQSYWGIPHGSGHRFPPFGMIPLPIFLEPRNTKFLVTV